MKNIHDYETLPYPQYFLHVLSVLDMETAVPCDWD